MVVRSKVIRIGNSRGVRIPRTLLEQAGLEGDVVMIVRGDQLIIQSARANRQGWDEQFARMAGESDDQLLDEMTPTRWDEEEWTW